jgi:hypothetical protein
MDRFDKFSDGARKVLTLAQDEAQRFDHNYIGTEHLLLALIREEEEVAAQVLVSLGVELPKVRTAVEFIIGRGDRPVVGEVGLTPGAKRVIELAIDEARRLGHRYIGTEHLLLGLVREGEGVAAGVLESMGVSLDKVRHAVIRLVAGGRAPNREVDVGIARRLVETEESRLERVIGIGQVATHQGVSLELIALEIRLAGCVLHWKADFSDRPFRIDPELTVRDDLGTVYEPRPYAWSHSGRDARGQITIVPPPPRDAGYLWLEFRVSTLPQDEGSGETYLRCEVRLRA